MSSAADPPDVRSLRLLAGEATSALVDGAGTIVWWCAPRPDSSPVFWQLLGPGGGAASWPEVVDARPVDDNVTADACVATMLVMPEGRLVVRDTLLETALVRSMEAIDGALTVVAEVTLTALDDAPPIDVLGADRTKTEGPVTRCEIDLDPGRIRHLALATGDTGRLDLEEALRRRHREWAAVGRRARLPRDHPQRAMDALRVLAGCTYASTGAVIAAPTTSLPEAPGGDRQWDYRYSWLRDATAAASIASQLGQLRVADRYLEFVCSCTGLGDRPIDPVVTVTGDELPEERELDHEPWGGGRPVRVGNGAAGQEQVDALGFFGEALWTHRLWGGRVTGHQHHIVERLADGLVAPPGPTNGIWELREPLDLVSAEIGRWLLLDRAIRLGRLRRPWRRPPAAWVTACEQARGRVHAAIGRHGFAPLTFHGPWSAEADAAGLIAVVVGLMAPDDPRSHRLVDATIDALGDGPFLRRYRSSVDDGFDGDEGAFVPASWWVVSALAVLGRIEEAEERADAMCKALPLLMPEEWDVASHESRGNLPLAWSHMEGARALALLHRARIRRRTGRAGLAAWRVWRYALVKLSPT